LDGAYRLAIKVALNHRTTFKYDKEVSLGPQVARLRPSPHCRTPILSYGMTVSPNPVSSHWHQDPNGNYLARLLFAGKTEELVLEVDLIADLSPINPFDYFLEPEVEHYPFRYPDSLARSLEPYVELQPGGPLFQKFIDQLPVDSTPTLSFLVDLNQRIRDQVGYLTRFEPGIQTVEETLSIATGSCRDSSWLLVQVLRHLGIASRFVSGYLVQLASAGAEGEGEKQDSLDLHAWAEAYLPGAGWIGFDPTSGLMATEGHIPLACTPEPPDAAPITGTVERAGVAFSYSMTARRLLDAPNGEKPYLEQDWAAIEQVAREVDKHLAERDVRLTMGGEPTFVGIDEPDSPEWNGDAIGPLKRARAITLIRRIQEKWAPGALLHFGQGKWYPGEVLPRWALSCHWRADRIPIWEHPNLIAEEERDYGLGREDAFTFINALTRRLRVEARNVIPAYEDAFYYVWRERRLPVNVDVFDSKLLNSREREDLARVFERGLGEAVGYVLPIRRRQYKGRLFWSSQLWFLRPERLLLLQGSSPVGYRLPLDSLPWVAPDDLDFEYENDPFSDEGPFPPRQSHLELFEAVPQADPLPADPIGGEGSK
jgi:transglutaminase-like putative cysteine protease